jgi:hypothetical protein
MLTVLRDRWTHAAVRSAGGQQDGLAQVGAMAVGENVEEDVTTGTAMDTRYDENDHG